MRQGAHCPVCGRADCGLHDSVLAFAHLVDRCVMVGIALLSGLILIAMILVNG